MSYNATVHKVMIACPGDVETERQTARKVLYKWNDLHSEEKDVVLSPIAWDTHIAPEMGAHPQEIIDKRILDGTDLLIGIFLHRLGTPTLDAQSGTAHEIDFHTNAGKPAMIYFLKENIDPAEFNKDQYDKLMAFKKHLETKGLLHECNRNEFEDKFLEHLIITVNNNEYFQAEKLELSTADFGDFDDTDTIEMSDEAKQLLLEAAKDKHRCIIRTYTSGGSGIQTNGKNMMPSQEPRIVAKWEHAIAELIENDFVEEKGAQGALLQVTHKGYEYADRLSDGD